MSTGARTVVAAVALLALLAVASLAVLGSLEVTVLWFLFVGWAVWTILWVVMPAGRSKHGVKAMTDRTQLWVILGVVAVALLVVGLVAAFPGSGGADSGSTRGAAAVR